MGGWDVPCFLGVGSHRLLEEFGIESVPFHRGFGEEVRAQEGGLNVFFRLFLGGWVG